ncbi:MAG: glycosyltransferase family 4 protein [Comamonas sp.]|jgi:UDP-GlcNAc:undecaprenyl-phosphate GlcNAc-1-phosphate transferase|nr:glycosyltransferase family 4 protein [Comamonas sp.]
MVWLSVIAFFVSLVIGAIVLRSSQSLAQIYGEDMPQRIHAGEIPRLGGISLLAGVLVSWWAGAASTQWMNDPSSLSLRMPTVWWSVALLPAVLGGIAEDLTQRLQVLYRLLFTLLTGVLAVVLLDLQVPRLDLEWVDWAFSIFPWLGIAITLLAIAGLPHAFNIIDGCNGLAGVVALIICLALAYVALQVGDRALAAMLVTTAAATAGFLFWNYPRGMLFAGDGGAYLWGVVIAIASISLVQRHPQVSPWFPMLLLIYPVWETMFSIYRKWARGMSPGMADALHFHQLIYRRVVWGVFHDDASRDMLMRNNRTSPYLWAFTLLSVVPAVLFWRTTWVLMLCCGIFIVLYVVAYLSIVRFKLPGWMQH